MEVLCRQSSCISWKPVYCDDGTLTSDSKQESTVLPILSRFVSALVSVI